MNGAILVVAVAAGLAFYLSPPDQKIGNTLVATLAAVIVAYLILAIHIVRQSEVIILERLGVFSRVLGAGLQFIWPFFERPRTVFWQYRVVERLDLREQVFDIPKQNVITKDNVAIEMNALLYFQITDPVRAVYEIANLPEAIEKLTQTTLRSIIGDMNLDDTLASRDTINAQLKVVLDDATSKWGVKVNRVEVQEIVPPKDIRDAMEKQMRAERDRRAAILEAEGQKQSQILRAEGQRDADINQAEGEAQARIRRAEGEAQAIAHVTRALADAGANPAQYLVAMRYLDVFQKMTSDKDKLILIPYEATAILGALEGVRSLVGTESAGK